MPAPCCRFCQSPLHEPFVDLGLMPLANSFLQAEQLQQPEPVFPLQALVCSQCTLVQLNEVVPPQTLFNHYTYFSSYSTSWMAHARVFAHWAIEAFALDGTSKVLEIASNDGYLLQHFMAQSIPCLGVEPARNVAEFAIANGIPTDIRFFGLATARDLLDQGWACDLIVANNVLAHVPDLNDFIAGLKLLLKPLGVISIEVPHLLRLIESVQFDTIYHEHVSYFSLLALTRIFEAHGLSITSAQALTTHGGSLRLLIRHESSPDDKAQSQQDALLAMERQARLDEPAGYKGFQSQVESVCQGLVAFLQNAYHQRKTVAAYGAAAKGSVLLNQCRVRTELIQYVADRSPHKQGLFLPGSHLPVTSPERVFETRPDYLLILPHNLKSEIQEQMSDIRHWGGQFVTAIPRIEVFP